MCLCVPVVKCDAVSLFVVWCVSVYPLPDVMMCVCVHSVICDLCLYADCKV